MLEQLVVALGALRIVALDVEDMPPPAQIATGRARRSLRRHIGMLPVSAMVELRDHAELIAQLVTLHLAGGGARQVGDRLEAPRLLVARQHLRQPLARRLDRGGTIRRPAPARRTARSRRRPIWFSPSTAALSRIDGNARRRVLDLGRRHPETRDAQDIARCGRGDDRSRRRRGHIRRRSQTSHRT